MDHYRNPRNMTDLSQLAEDCQYENPSCGDWVRVHIELDGEIVKRIVFDGEGCSLSIASASMMSQQLAGFSVNEARMSAASFVKAIREGTRALDPAEWGDLASFDEIRSFPIRQKCVLLPFRALLSELEKLEVP
ncbi:MAG: SUF system NifU family Fe-S cluster assembly protein [Spirochaetales bacterium]|nr:SUF system NifU family Fe-S cluster assembly protein [Spirochaetales bacterium]